MAMVSGGISASGYRKKRRPYHMSEELANQPQDLEFSSKLWSRRRCSAMTPARRRERRQTVFEPRIIVSLVNLLAAARNRLVYSTLPIVIPGVHFNSN